MPAAYTTQKTRSSEQVQAGFQVWEGTGITTTAGYVDVPFTDESGTAYSNGLLPVGSRSLLEVTVDPGTTQTTLVKVLKRTSPNANEVELLAETTVASDTPAAVYSGVVRAHSIVVQLKQGDGAVTDAAVYVCAK